MEPTTERNLTEMIQKWKISNTRKSRLDADRYFRGEHDILSNVRTGLTQKGNPFELKYLPNNKIIDNKYRKYVLQIQNYFTGRPFVYRTENEQLDEALGDIITHKFRNTICRLTADALNHGIAWLCPYVSDGELRWKRFAGYEIIPIWADDEHTDLREAYRVFQDMDGKWHCDKYTADGVEHYDTAATGMLELSAVNPFDAWFLRDIYDDDSELEAVRIWDRVPLIPFRSNAQELPMLSPCVKSLQDGINKILSNLLNNMLEDPRESLLVVTNYDGQDFEELRVNMSEFGIIPIRDDGGVDTLHLEVNSENYKAVLNWLSKSLMENMCGFDGSTEKLGSNPNQMNIQSMYSDIDCFVNGMEREFQSAFEDVLYFVKTWIRESGKGDFMNDDIEIVFNRDVLVNQSQIIADLTASAGILSRETLVAQHPFVEDVDEEIKRLEQESDVTIAGDFPDSGE